MDKNSELQEVATLMRSEWDDRISTDYRYWMSDGVSDDNVMWQSGSRDFSILTKEIPEETLKNSKVLDVGCGVGRILIPSSYKVKEITGIDVSKEAITKAEVFKESKSNINLYVGNGLNLDVLKDKDFDLLISFAALCSIPSRVVADYLSEFGRVVKEHGQIRIQIYLGKEQLLSQEDTLALRSYQQDKFLNAIKLAGFNVNYLEEINLDFEVSDYEKGIVAYIVGGVRNSSKYSSGEEIYRTLISNEEKVLGKNWEGSETACLVSLARVRQLMEMKDTVGAKDALTLAKRSYRGSDLEINTILNELESKLNENKAILSDILVSRFDNFFSTIDSIEGESILYKGISLSHQSKPITAANNWVERTLNSLEYNDNSPIFLVGLGDSNFLSVLREKYTNDIIVYEENSYLINYSKNKLKIPTQIITNLKEFDSYLETVTTNLNLVILPSAPFYMNDSVESIRKKIRVKFLNKAIRPNIGIVGPLYGGTLPIAGYIQNALRNLDHRSEFIDLSGYLGTYNSFEKFLKKKNNKDMLESGFIQLMSDLVYQIVEERKLDIIISVALTPLSPTILEKLNKKGVITAHWFMEDTRRFSTWREIAKYYDYFFLFQKGESIEEVKNAGGNRVNYLPLAYSPDIHKEVKLSSEDINQFGSQVSFVGAGYNNRRHIFSKLSDLDVKIWGTEWPDVIPFKRMVQRSGARISVEDYIKIFNSSDININLHSSHERDGIDPSGDSVNPRTFELAGCKAFQLVDERTLLPELFNVNEEIITFESLSDLREKINYYKNKPDLRAEISNKAFKRAEKDHTYEKRLEQMLELILLDFGDSLNKKIQNGPWPRTFQSTKDLPELNKRFKIVYEKGEEPTLEALVGDIVQGKGKLSEDEMKLMFLHHMRGQITQVNKLRGGSGV